MTILILGGADDEHAVHMLHFLRNRGHDSEMLDSREFPARLRISFNPRGTGMMVLPCGRSLSFDEIGAVYWRS
jgi:hypothetical protein